MGGRRDAPGKKGRQHGGSITIFLALSFVLIAALLLTIAESARTVSQRLYMQVALDSAMESLFSQFHRPLWENYRVFGLEYRTDKDLAEELYNFMLPYLECRDLFPSKVAEEDIRFSGQAHLTDDIYYEEEILEYMKYGMIDSLIRFAGKGTPESSLPQELSNLFQQADESEDLVGLQHEYQLDNQDLTKVEAAISKVANACAAIKRHFDTAADALGAEKPSRYFSASAKLRASLDSLSSAIESYCEAADALAVKVKALRERFSEQRGNLSAEGARVIDTEIREYENYVSKSGSVRRKITALDDKNPELLQRIATMDEDVSDFEEWLSEEMEKEDEDDDYDFTRAIRRFYQAARREWVSFPIPSYDGDVSKINTETQNKLKSLQNLLGKDLLSIVLPEGAEFPSEEKINETHTAFSADSTANPIQIVLLGEYAFKYFHYYHKDDTVKGALPPSGVKNYEMEYLLNGEASDYANLSAFVNKLLLLREAMNLIYLYSDSQKRGEAEIFVTTLLCVTANPVLISVFTFFVLGIWALGQAIQDIKTLLNDGKVPIMHNRQSWSLDLDGLMGLASGGDVSASDNRDGLSYRDYLRVFLFGEGILDQGKINTRMLSRIDGNLRSIGENPKGSFDIGHILYASQATVEANARHIMYEQGIVQMAAGKSLDSIYSFTLDSYYKYKNETH